MPSSLRSKNLINRRRNRRLAKAIFLLITLVAFIFAPSLLSKNSYLQIKSVEIKGNQLISKNEIMSVTLGELSGDYLSLYSKANIFLYPKNKIKSEISSRFPRIKEVETELKDQNNLIITVSEREPSALWCEKGEEECFLLDEEGFIFDKSPGFSPQVYLTFRGESRGDDPIGEFVLSKERFTNVSEFLKGMERLNLSPRELLLEGEDVVVSVSEGAEILFNSTDDVYSTLSNLESVLNDQKLQLRSGDELNVSRIDLRFGNKVFYRE
jgi:hypothetical protein